MNILITGVAGLLGSRLADYLIQNIPNVNIIGIDDLSGGYVENINPKVIFYDIDCNDLVVEEIFEHNNIDYVYHFAAYAAEGLSPFIRRFNYKNNLLSTANIINNCIKYDVKRLIFTSSIAVYGHGKKGRFEEFDTPKPIDPYGVAKYACEMDIQIAGEQHGLDWCIIRPHNVYGEKQNIWDNYRNVLGIWMYQHLNNEPLTIFGDGTQTRAFSNIEDIVRPLFNAAIYKSASKQIINLGGIEEYSINKAANILSNIMGGEDIVYKEQRHEVKHAIPSYQKSIEILGFSSDIELENGLKSMWHWAKQQPKRDKFIWDKYELDKGIYNSWKL